MDNKQLVLDIVAKTRLVAVIRLPSLETAIELSRALIAGGVTALEFTMTSPNAPQAIRDVKAALPEFAQGKAVVGAGSVNSPEEAYQVLEAGAQFIVSPSTKLPVIQVARAAGVPVMPGAFTPTEIETAREAGADVIKVFPADTLGPAYIKAVLAPLPHLKLIPTGGVSLDNIAAYIQSGAFAVGVGTALLDKPAVAAGNWAAVTAKAAQYAQAAANA